MVALYMVDHHLANAYLTVGFQSHNSFFYVYLGVYWINLFF